MKLKLTSVAVVAAFLMVSCGKNGGTGGTGSSDEIKLELNLEKGKKYKMDMTMNAVVEMSMMGQTINSTTDMTMMSDYEVMDITSAGGYKMRSTYTRVKMGGSAMGMSYSYDTETGEANGMQAEQMADNIKKMVGQYVEMEMAKNGKISNITMSDGIKSSDGKEMDMSGMQFAVFPDKAVKSGDTWTSELEQNLNGVKAKVVTNYKLVSVKDGIAEVSMDGTITALETDGGKIDGTQKGTSKIVVATGLANETIIDQDISVEVDRMGTKMPMKLKNKITITIK